MREKLGRLGRRLLQLEKETRYPAHPPSTPAEAYVADVGASKCFVSWELDGIGYTNSWSQSFKTNVVQSTVMLHHFSSW